ncbi:luciferase family protein [Streptomyces sp. NPDC091279]|uniref:luciferase domain-containing protein n=1 Tax=unclassified Streptomyces TaxID=2593676 RepID=UPI00380FF6B8
MTPAQRALQQLETWPDLSPCPAGCGTGRALRSTRDEIVHFHSDRDVDLHLTDPAIARLHHDIAESTAIRMVPGSRWVTVHLDCDTDVDLLLSLVSVALKAHQAGPVLPVEPVAAALCNFHRVTVLPREG